MLNCVYHRKDIGLFSLDGIFEPLFPEINLFYRKERTGNGKQKFRTVSFIIRLSKKQKKIF